MTKLIEYFVPAELNGDRDQTWARFLVVVAFTSPLLWFGFSLWYAASLGHGTGAIGLLVGVGICSSLVPSLLRKTGSVSIGANALAVITFAGITALAMLRGGFPFAVLLWTIAIPVAMSRRHRFRAHAWFWLAATLTQFGVFYILALTGNAPAGLVERSPGQVIDGHFFVLVAFLLLMVIVSYSTSKVTEGFASERDEYLDALVNSQRVESLGSMAGGIAHDFNNVLTAVQFSSDVIGFELPADHQLQREVEQLRAAIERSRALTRQLLNLGRAQTNTPEPLGINNEIKNLEPMLRRVLRSSISIELCLAQELPDVRIDSSRLEQVLINLAVNANDAIGAEGRLTIRTFKSGSSVVIEVVDTGSGIPREVAARIFEAFFTTKDEGKGSGLGLWISRTIVRDAGGELSLESSPGHGTTVQIKLPPCRRRPSLASGSRSIQAIPAAEAGCILLVDDDDTVLRTVELMLTKRGYDVICADNCERALDLVTTDGMNIDLVITDVVLPGMGGTELADRLRTAKPGIKVLLMSGHSEASQQRSAFIAKPFKADELVTFVQDSLANDKPN